MSVVYRSLGSFSIDINRLNDAVKVVNLFAEIPTENSCMSGENGCQVQLLLLGQECWQAARPLMEVSNDRILRF